MNNIVIFRDTHLPVLQQCRGYFVTLIASAVSLYWANLAKSTCEIRPVPVTVLTSVVSMFVFGCFLARLLESYVFIFAKRVRKKYRPGLGLGPHGGYGREKCLQNSRQGGRIVFRFNPSCHSCLKQPVVITVSTGVEYHAPRGGVLVF